MVMELDINIEEELENPLIQGLDLSMFGADDLMNLILQRSEVLFDVNKKGRVTRAWQNGDDSLVKEQVERLGDQIAYRTAAQIYGEYRTIEPLLEHISPKKIADIGCGYAFFDLFAARQLNCGLLLIDLEENEHQHFGFADEGAAYSSLEKTRAMLRANGVDGRKITTVNPKDKDVMKVGKVDLAVSFLSCGFHYPVDSYLDFFQNKITPNGGVVLDFRTGTMPDQITALAERGLVLGEELASAPKVRRILLKRGES